jgi:preprotein translocase subunit SecA
MRQFEREIMLQLIDQRWREHLSEMDYLREGINLRAMGQRDPLVEWQRDGYEMFGQMMSSIDDDYVKYVMHAQVQVMDRPAIDPGLVGAQYLAPEGPVLGSQAIAGALAAGPAPGEEVVFAAEDGAGALGVSEVRARANGDGAGDVPPVRVPAGPASEFDRAGRNDPCPCGSGKKFKFCHGK